MTDTLQIVSHDVRERLLDDYNDRIKRFEKALQRDGVESLGPMPDIRAFICRRYDLCAD